ncbi:uncharacterized protein LOC129961636 [Argiope bruennichi]|uniref:uncharacterized protein LOC129961636 n=1 Tax=Argiope bruennichi TaxID=94029 RepID=UPI0024950F95|nr:uncharacterized protein LOC129961636 [Argiope bruennichi]XP_055931135.1 uncharacterized protein LOC129961636 [Argiope bruennichi]XP_055931136.1 uncharacterized protein LOC129961636 [Argiope bruennichi]
MASRIETEDSALGNNRGLNESHWEYLELFLIFIIITIPRVCWSYIASLSSSFKGLFFKHYIAVPVLLLSVSTLTAVVITLRGLVRLIVVIYCLSFFVCSIISLCFKQGAIMFIDLCEQVEQQENVIDPQDLQEVLQPTRDSAEDEKILLHKALKNLLGPIPETEIKPDERRTLQIPYDDDAAVPYDALDTFPPLNHDDDNTTRTFRNPDSCSPSARGGTYSISYEDISYLLTSRHFDADGSDSHEISQPLSEARIAYDARKKFVSFIKARLNSFRKLQRSYSYDYSAAGPSHAPDPFPPLKYVNDSFVEPSHTSDLSSPLNQDNSSVTRALHTPDSCSSSAHDRTYNISYEDITDLLKSTHFDAEGCDPHEIFPRLSEARLSADAIKKFGYPVHVLGADSYRIFHSSDENCISDEQALLEGNTFEASVEVHHPDSHRSLSSNNDGSSSVEPESITTDENARGVISDLHCDLPYEDINRSSESFSSQ